MNDIEQKAMALVNEVRSERGLGLWRGFVRNNEDREALCRAIERHEADKAAHKATIDGILQSHQAFRQEVSNAVGNVLHNRCDDAWVWVALEAFIIPAPKPDQLVDAMAELAYIEPKLSADKLRAALEARGLEIREKNDD